MSFVWFTSYLCIFVVGFITSLFFWNAIINKMVDIQEKKLVRNPAKKTETSPVPDSLTENQFT